MLHIARQLKRQRAGRSALAVIAIEGRAAREDHRHRGEGDHVVDALEHGGLFAAGSYVCGLAHLECEGVARARHALAQPAGCGGARDRLVQRFDRIRVFAAHIDVAARRTHCDRGNRHAFDQHVRVALHRHAIGEGARVAFVGIADHVLLRTRGSAYRLPLDACRERRATTPAQS